jgi:DNA-binding NarL/FixJ family response regulator
MIRVFVEDHALTRYVLRIFLTNESDVKLAGEYDGTGDVLADVEAAHPDAVLFDY